MISTRRLLETIAAGALVLGTSGCIGNSQNEKNSYAPKAEIKIEEPKQYERKNVKVYAPKEEKPAWKGKSVLRDGYYEPAPGEPDDGRGIRKWMAPADTQRMPSGWGR